MCTYWSHKDTPVTDNQTIRLRQGEMMILQCKRDTQVHTQLTLGGSYKVSKYCDLENTDGDQRQPLNYTWHCNASSNGSIVISGFEIRSKENLVTLLHLNIQVYDIDNVVERPTPRPCTPPPPERDTPNQGANQQGNPLSDDVTTTSADTRVSESVGTTSDVYIGIIVCLSVVVVLLILVLASLVVIIAVKYRQVNPDKRGDGEANTSDNSLMDPSRVHCTCI